jgi:hypothetical protein
MNPKLAPLVRMLAAPHDGEVLATVAAIRRTLAASGQDLHDLARLIERDAPAATAPPGGYATQWRGFSERLDPHARPDPSTWVWGERFTYDPDTGLYWTAPPKRPRRRRAAA